MPDERFIYQYERILRALNDKFSGVCGNVFIENRPAAYEQMEEFLVIRLPQGIQPYADTHDTAYVQMICFVRDKHQGLVDAARLSHLAAEVKALCPFNDGFISCNEKPKQAGVTSDGTGFHSIVIQFKIVISL